MRYGLIPSASVLYCRETAMAAICEQPAMMLRFSRLVLKASIDSLASPRMAQFPRPNMRDFLSDVARLDQHLGEAGRTLTSDSSLFYHGALFGALRGGFPTEIQSKSRSRRQRSALAHERLRCRPPEDCGGVWRRSGVRGGSAGDGEFA